MKVMRIDDWIGGGARLVKLADVRDIHGLFWVVEAGARKIRSAKSVQEAPVHVMWMP